MKNKKEKDRKFIGKLIDRPSTNNKKIRPKSSKGIRNNIKTTSASAVPNPKNGKAAQKASDYLNSNIQGNQMRGKQGRSKKKNQNYSQFAQGDVARYLDNEM